MVRKLPRGFTLIELLMVVAIIAILAAIAIPNFLEAQTRSKVSRAMSDLRTIGTAIESYRTDNNNYPTENYPSTEQINVFNGMFLPNAIKLRPLTTPIAYMTRIPADVFDPGTDPSNQVVPHTYHYVSQNDPVSPGAPLFEGANPEHLVFQWMVQSYGPDLGRDMGNPASFWQFPRYDPTNGTTSIGNILRSGP